MMKVKNKKIGSDEETFIIAEMACSHDGSMRLQKNNRRCS